MVTLEIEKFPMVTKNAQHGLSTGFDTAADFIPFEFSDDDGNDGRRGTDTDTSRQPDRAGERDEAATAAPSTLATVNGHAQKRKRNDIDASSERLPSAQRRRLDIPGSGNGVNPWQSSPDANAHNETAKMYPVCPTCRGLMHG